MNRDKMIEALAKAAYCHDGAKPYPRDSAAKCDKYANQWAWQRLQAESIAAAVLDLCGPEPLVWSDDEDGCLRCGPYDIWAFDRGITLLYWQVVYADDFPTLEAAQAAAQSHATAAHWANTPLGKLVGVV